MIWSDTHIRNHKELISPFTNNSVQPASYDLHLGDKILVDGELVKLPYVLKPNQFILGTTIEKITLPNNVAAQVDGKSSIGRLGVLVHFTAGWIDPGFSGEITLEMYNVNKEVKLTTGMPIAQIIFQDTYTVAKPYNMTGHYNNQKGPTPSVLKL